MMEEIENDFPQSSPAERSDLFWARTAGLPDTWGEMYTQYEQDMHDGLVPPEEMDKEGVERALIRARMVRLPPRLLRH